MSTVIPMTDKKAPDQTFTEMAERILRNPPEEFAGAYVIISPKGTVLSHAFINPTGDESSFWGFINASVQTAGTEAVEREEVAGLVQRGLRR